MFVVIVHFDDTNFEVILLLNDILHVSDGVHIPGSPFKIKVGGDRKRGDGSVRVLGAGLDRVKVTNTTVQLIVH